MDIKSYILSGIIESYVLRLATPEERREFEQYCAEFPELVEARTAFELSLEKAAIKNAVTPSVDLKSKITGQIGTHKKVISLPKKSTSSINWLQYAVAACLLILAGSIYQTISLSNENKNLKRNYNATLSSLNQMKEDMKVLQENPHVKMASMKGMDASPQSYATVYWDTASHDVYLLANNLPAPPGNKQYQLWALLEGKPIDLGMLDYNLKQNKLLLRMKNVLGAEAFAITLEKKGGNPTPEGAMYVMGKL